MSEEEPKDVFNFPCTFPLKAIGLDLDDFEAYVVSVVSKYVPVLEQGMVSSRLSTSGKYRSVTVTFIAESRPQVEAIYRELHDGKRVLFDL